ncbi:hypothetical protein HC256_009728 [Beauveria bassiana]|uniref:Secreted protein CSS2 C-terminal domain-containing protein n=1 Tax=Beauveria bassiana (strain ARSEF 2860) TaxID=655819 RepID=J5JIY6_BEAB2|nr:uncharacterized protein BBA_07690 [Beauveria bassiana ARSEF 2860]EJP63296.1 hypothetical protein BBA_07690 [Beauveria bassiana ARSEF 2860]KAH8709819.1 hypothetical protein HC256_009728 [Beauveria bassiana]
MAAMALRLSLFALLSCFVCFSFAQSDGEIIFGISDLDLGYFEEHGDLHPNATNMLVIDHNSTSLAARKNDHVCSANVGTDWHARCYGWTGAVASVGIFAVGVANLLKSASDKHECGYYIDNHGPLQVAIHADAPNCHTTSQKATIEGAITKWINTNLKYGSCNVQCLHVDHYGNWHGYIAFGVLDGNINQALSKCISVHKTEQCVSGGKYDRG